MGADEDELSIDARRIDMQDVEKQDPPIEGQGQSQERRRLASVLSLFHVQHGIVYEVQPEKHPKWYQRLLDFGVEENGIKPVPVEERTNRNYSNLFTIFFTSLLCLLPIPTGLLGTLAYGLSLRDASLVILFFSMLTCLPPAFMGLGGSRTGMRQQIQTRYAFGLYLATIPLLLNAATVTGFCLVSAIVSGQSLSALNPETVSLNVGIVITCVVSFGASLLGYRALHFWERWTWIPNLISLVVAVGCGGKYLHLQTVAPPATAPQVLSFASLIAGYFLTYGGTVSDYSIYHNPSVSPVKIFLYIYLGLLLPSVPLLVLGAAIGGAVPQVATWNTAYQALGVGGVMYEMLAPAAGFGKFIMVLLALSVIGNIAMSMYSVALNLQMLLPFFAKVHRFFFVAVTIAILIPFSIKAAEEWEQSLENFLGIIGYWAGCYTSVLIEELVIFRKMDFSSYDHAIWNVGRKLPSGVPAIMASILSFGLVVPGMAEVWYTGPIAETTGDIGFETAFVLTWIFYLPLRWLEIRWRGRL